jgi:flagellar hook-associated protein 1 FlgK
MSLSVALSNASSGLSVTGRQAELVSSNVANSSTEGYGVRRLETSSQSVGGDGRGVRVDGVSRYMDQALVADRRVAEGARSNAEITSNALISIEGEIGYPSDGASLSGRIDDLGTKLIDATSRPDSETRLAAIIDSAKALTAKFNNISSAIQGLRLNADQAIAGAVETLNENLIRLDDLNQGIVKSRAIGRDPSALLDQQQILVDEIAQIIPVRETRDDRGQLVLYSSNGMALLEGSAGTFSFSPIHTLTPDMTIESGALSGLSLNGRDLRIGGENSDLGKGALSAQFEVRDDIAIKAQGRIDGLALDLTTRFDAAFVDDTHTVGTPGLFTDRGALAIQTNEVGLAARLSLNAIVDPNQGGDITKIRDGLGSTLAGPVSNGTRLQNMTDAMAEKTAPVSAAYNTGARDFSSLSSDFLSLISSAAQSAEEEFAFSDSRFSALREEELSNGVDTNAEMQMLLTIEDAFAANARVLQTIDEMLDSILRI